MERSGSIGVDLEGMDQVMKALERAGDDVRDAAMTGLKAGADDILADAQRNLRVNGSWVTGNLAQSGRVIARDGSVDVGFFDTTNANSGYAMYVEYGRRAGRFPPLDVIVQWARKKLRLDDKAARTVGFLTARKIALEGSRPHPFFRPAIEKNRRSILNAVEDAIRQATK